MATADKHRARSHRTNYKKRMNKAWFYNHRAYQVWLDSQRQMIGTAPDLPATNLSEVPVEKVTPEVVE